MKNQETGIALNWNYVIFSIVVFVTLMLLVLYWPNMRAIDENILHSVKLALSPYPSYIPAFVSEFGYTNYMFWPQFTAVCVLVSHKHYMKSAILIGAVWLTYFLKDLIKEFVCRPRPEAVCSGFGFPSGHCAITMCFYGILIYLVLRHVHEKFWRYFLVTLFSVWIFMSGVSRMWLGAHFLSDVLAGMFLGFFVVNLYIIITKSISK